MAPTPFVLDSLGLQKRQPSRWSFHILVGWSAFSQNIVHEYVSGRLIILYERLVARARIDKMRGIDYDEQHRRYAVTGKGLMVFNTEPVPL